MIHIPPDTSPSRYLSGMVALNVPSPEGTGDWHQDGTFFMGPVRIPRGLLAGPGCEWDTTPYLGQVGVIDVSSRLDAAGIPHPEGPVWAADHARAIADMVIGHAVAGRVVAHVDLDAWMHFDEDKDAVFALLDIAMYKLSQEAAACASRWLAAARAGQLAILDQEPEVKSALRVEDIPSTGLKAFIADLAARHGVSYVETNSSRLAQLFTELSGDDVKPDDTEKLVIALRKADVIDGPLMVALLGAYFDETRM